MRKLALLFAAMIAAAALPALAHEQGSAGQRYGGHYRHMHRDWSGVGGRGHVHNVCWAWDGWHWEWVCR